MPYARPTLTALRNHALQDVTTSGVPGTDGLLRNAVLRVLTWVLSGLAYSLYGYLDWIAHQAVPFTATEEYLEAWAGLIAVLRKDASAASGQAQFSGTTGRVIPEGTPVVRLDGVPYVTTADGTIDAAGYVIVPIHATTVGRITDAPDATPINIQGSIAGVNASGITIGALTGGADQETDPELRTRMLAKYAAPPMGGAFSDYQVWALDVPGVTRVWVHGQGQGPGTVVVYPMLDNANAANGGFPIGSNGVSSREGRDRPALGDQLRIADAIWPVQPVTALVFVVSPVAFPVDVELTNMVPNTVEIQEAIVASLEDTFLLSGEVGGIIYPSQLYQAILATPGLEHFTMLSPTLEVQVPPGGLPVMGMLTVI